jgi:hypothetical protein
VLGSLTPEERAQVATALGMPPMPR